MRNPGLFKSKPPAFLEIVKGYKWAGCTVCAKQN